MPGYVTTDKPDIFVSYAHVNDLSLDEKEPGWVTRLIKQIEVLLTMKIGRREFFELWMDPRLTGNEPVTPLIEGRVRESAIFLLILSRGYLASTWTNQELNVFHEQLRDRKADGSRVFVIEFEKVERPAVLSELRGYRFWTEDTLSRNVATMGFPKLLPDAEDRYYRLIDELSRDLVNELDRQKKASTAQPAAVPGPVPGGAAGPSDAGEAGDPQTVYLADVTDDLEDLRDSVKGYLIQAGYRILPRTVYPNDLAGYEASLDADLRHSSMFVQLVSELPGRKFVDDGPRRVAVVLSLAARRDPPIPILQWRSRDLNCEKVTDEAHRKLLKGEGQSAPDLEMMAADLEEFKAAVKRRLVKLAAPQEVKSRSAVQDRFMFINADSPDDPLALAVTRELERWPWVGYATPLREGDPEQIRVDLEQNLIDCDAMMVIFGQAQPVWARSQLQLARKLSAVRTKGPLPIALYEGPPLERPSLNYHVARMTVLNCRTGHNPSELERFVTSLQPDGVS